MTASTRIGWMAVGLFIVVVGAAWAGTGPWQLTLVAESIGAAGASDNPAPDNRQKAEELLRRARQAMGEKDLATAESLIAQAEAMKVDYGPFHLGDTPKRARRELERHRRAAGPSKPSRFFLPGLEGKKNVPEKDPFAGQAPKGPAAEIPAAHAGAPLSEPRPFPGNPAGGADPDLPDVLARSMRNTASPGSTAIMNPYATEGDSPIIAAQKTGQSPPLLLRDARKALAFGDVRRAADLAARAEQLNVTGGPGGDSPQKVQEAIRKMSGLNGIDKSSEAYRRAYARNLLEQADALILYGDLPEAEQLARVADSQRVIYSPYDPKPQDVLGRIAAARKPGGMPPAGEYVPAPTADPRQALDMVRQARAELTGGQVERAAPALYQPDNDITRNLLAANQAEPPRPLPPTASTETLPLPDPAQANAAPPSAKTLFEQGETALRAKDKEKAFQLFQKAAARRNELDPQTAQLLQDRLQLLSVRTNPLPQPGPASPGATPNLAGPGAPPNLANEAVLRQQALVRQVGAEIAHLEASARAVRDSDPNKALALLDEARKKVDAAGLQSAYRDQMLRRVERAINETRQFIEENRPRLELAASNDRVRNDVDRTEKVKIDKRKKIAQMVEEIKRLTDERRYAEAQVLARQAVELDPKDPVAQQMEWIATMLWRMDNINQLKSANEEGFMRTLDSVDVAGVPFDDRNPIVYPDAQKWKQLSERRLRGIARMRHRTERELDIERKLKTPVSLAFNGAPLGEVITTLAKMADINIFLDPRGLEEEAVTTDRPVTINNIHGDIALESALKLILEPLHLNYIIKNDVLNITSEQMCDGDTYTVTYNVADLVVPIPNFVPVPMGLDAAYQNAMSRAGYGLLGLGGGGNGAGTTPMAVVASRDGKECSGMVNPQILAQMGSQAGGVPNANPSQPIGFGPGGAGGGTQADFDSLIELITNTVRPQSWSDLGGPGQIREFPMNLSLVITQTQQVHEEITDLLEQLRRLQDLQVTIEVRFITLSDSFFERIGVDFDFDVHTFEWAKTSSGFGSVVVPANPAGSVEPVRNTLSSERDKPATVGIQNASVTGSNGLPLYTSDLDIPFRQGNYGLAVPTFGGFDPAAGASLGFAILSDLETYFFITAAQGDKRTNVLQAPKVTLFNGQQAMVSDQSYSPFVISVIPVVGEFAAAQQPVIVILSEGTFMTVQAVVSQDRRFVRLTVVPFFSKIGDVNTFTFTGSQTTTTDTVRDGNQTVPDGNTRNRNYSQVVNSGTTVQLPTFSSVSVTTTVSVPDGGTVLLGGIKRLSEGRNEFGVPMLDKIPYLNRLFKDVGIGRETTSLMMMVTPRIIIQEEEEEALGVPVASRKTKQQY